MPMAILGLIVATNGEEDNGDRIVNGMETHENENDPDTVVGMTTVGMFELSLCLLLVAPWIVLDWHFGFWHCGPLRPCGCLWRLQSLTGDIWSLFARRPLQVIGGT